MDTWVNLIAAIAAIGSAVAAGAAYFAARKSDETAATVARIERARHHADLEPKLVIAARQTSEQRAELSIRLDGPAGMDRLDNVVVKIRDDTHLRGASTVAIGASADQVAATIWGPYRFAQNVDGPDPTGRTWTGRALPRGETLTFPLQLTDKPEWQTSLGQWRQEFPPHKIRIVAICTREGDEPWSFPWDIDVDQFKGG